MFIREVLLRERNEVTDECARIAECADLGIVPS